MSPRPKKYITPLHLRIESALVNDGYDYPKGFIKECNKKQFCLGQVVDFLYEKYGIKSTSKEIKEIFQNKIRRKKDPYTRYKIAFNKEAKKRGFRNDKGLLLYYRDKGKTLKELRKIIGKDYRVLRSSYIIYKVFGIDYDNYLNQEREMFGFRLYSDYHKFLQKALKLGYSCLQEMFDSFEEQGKSFDDMSWLLKWNPGIIERRLKKREKWLKRREQNGISTTD